MAPHGHISPSPQQIDLKLRASSAQRIYTIGTTVSLIVAVARKTRWSCTGLIRSRFWSWFSRGCH